MPQQRGAVRIQEEEETTRTGKYHPGRMEHCTSCTENPGEEAEEIRSNAGHQIAAEHQLPNQSFQTIQPQRKTPGIEHRAKAVQEVEAVVVAAEDFHPALVGATHGNASSSSGVPSQKTTRQPKEADGVPTHGWSRGQPDKGSSRLLRDDGSNQQHVEPWHTGHHLRDAWRNYANAAEPRAAQGDSREKSVGIGSTGEAPCGEDGELTRDGSVVGPCDSEKSH